MFWFTSDEHYGHGNILKHRPMFSSYMEMDAELIRRHNEVVGRDDVVVHAGDFCMQTAKDVEHILKQLNGNHILVKGNHDRWWEKNKRYIYKKRINGVLFVVQHYPMMYWPESDEGSIHVFGHMHGDLEVPWRAMDVGVDTNNFYPYSADEIIKRMKNKEERKRHG